MVVPFLLHLVRMAIPCNVTIAGAKDPGALIADFVSSQVVPRIQKRIGCRLYLLVRSHVDRAIGIEVIVRTGGNATGREIGAGIGHGSVESIAAKVTVISTEGREAARTAMPSAQPVTRVGLNHLPRLQQRSWPFP